MLLLKKIFLGIAALVLILAGGSGTQSSSILLQGGGFVGLIVGFVVLYIFGKLVWRAMGCLPSLIIIVGIIGFLLYAIGAFNGGVKNVVPNVQKFLGTHTASSGGSNRQGNSLQLVDSDDNTSAPVIGENFGDFQMPNQEYAPTEVSESIPAPTAAPVDCVPSSAEQPVAPMITKPAAAPLPPATPQQPLREPEKMTESGGIMGFVNSLLGGGGSSNSAPAEPRNFNPNDYPAVYGSVQVINGNTLLMRNHYIHLYGIDAPDTRQNCANSRGNAYACGKEAARWLQGWILDNEIECHVLKQDSKNNVMATCSYGQYDIGAALVSAGWAVALPGNTIYQPYELQAQKARRGMWQGQFYKPWDWRKMQAKKPKIKIIKPKTEKRLWDYM